MTDLWEFRYDSGRQRYLARRWDFYLEGGQYAAFDELSATWTDYLGGSAGVSPADPWPYVDYTVEEGTPPVIEEQMRYLAGFGVHAQEGVGQSPPAVRFLHGDLIRSTMLTTDETGSAGVSPAVAYTAFGEPVTPDGQGGWRIGFPPGAGGIGEPLGTRYQYAGGWGYETGPWGPGPGGQGGGGGLDVNGGLTLYGGNADLPPITLQHVGWRWYQPSAGRFIQRDPMGIRGGLNVYAYGVNNPLARVDAWGLAAEPPTTQEARGALRELVDAVVDAVTWGVRGTVRTMYNFCVLWVWVQEQNKRVFRPPAPPPLPPPPNPGGWIGPRPEGPPETPPIGPPPPPLRIY